MFSKMKPTLTTSSFWYEQRSHGKAGTRVGGKWLGDDGDEASTASGEEEDGGENAEVTCMKVCMFFKLRNGKKWSCVVITRPLPTNGGLKLIGQYTTSGNGIKPRFPRLRVKDGNLKGDANLFSFDGSSTGESTGRFLLKCCKYMDAYASTRVY